jgi:phage terminase large subunit-like protein
MTSETTTSPDSSAAPSLPLVELIRTLPGYDPFDQAEDCHFDEVEAQFYIDFIEQCIKLVKGTKYRQAGESFRLEWWQKAITANLFGWKRPDGLRRYLECLIYVAKKNGKTAFVAALIVAVASINVEFGAELYSIASSKDQAAILFGHAAGMVRLEGELSRRLTVYGAKGGSQQRSIVNEERMGTYRPLSADADTSDGLNPSFLAADEIHRYPDGELLEVMIKSMASRAQPLVVCTTTADYNRPSTCNDLLKRAKTVRDNKGDPTRMGYDPGFLPVIFEASKDDDWKSPATWRKANPNLGVTVTEEFLARECKKAEEVPSTLNDFLRLHLNIVTDASEAWMSMDRWAKCSGLHAGETPRQWRERMLELLQGETCFLGMDLSAKVDLTAIVQIFPPNDRHDKWIWIPHFWVPADTAHIKEKRDHVPYSAWERDGFVKLSGGGEVDTPALRAFINATDAIYPIQEIAYDDWNGTELSRQLRDEDGFKNRMWVVRQGHKSLSDPMKELEAMIVSGRAEHGANPAMDWMVGNIVAKKDSNANITPDKKESINKIDGGVALITGMARALAKPDEILDVRII